MAGGKIFQREIYFAKVCREFFDIFKTFLTFSRLSRENVKKLRDKKGKSNFPKKILPPKIHENKVC